MFELTTHAQNYASYLTLDQSYIRVVPMWSTLVQFLTSIYGNGVFSIISNLYENFSSQLAMTIICYLQLWTFAYMPLLNEHYMNEDTLNGDIRT